MVAPTGDTVVNPKPGALPPDTKAWLTREESARLLGVSTRTIKNYEKNNLLRPQTAARTLNGRVQNVVVHDPQILIDLDKIRQTKAKAKAVDLASTDTSSWYTRNQSIDVLHVSTQTLKNYERQGKLHPLRAFRRDARGHEQRVVVYDPKELSRLPRGIVPFTQRAAGEIEAVAFEMFEQGKSFREVVMALRQTSEMVHGLHERWLDDGGSFLVISAVSKQDLEAVLGPFTDVTELVDLVTAKCAGGTGNFCHENETDSKESQAAPGCTKT